MTGKLIDNMKDARINAKVLRAVCDQNHGLLADILVAEMTSDYVPGGFARYLCRAAFREMFAD